MVAMFLKGMAGLRYKTLATLGGALLAAVLLAAYANHFYNSFHFDDAHTIVNNAAIRDLRNIPLFFHDAATFSSLPSNQSYRPLASTLLAIDYRLGAVKPFHKLTVEQDREKVSGTATANANLPSICARSSAG